MGLVLDPRKIITQSNSVIEVLKEDNKNLYEVLNGISSFLKKEGLKGIAWDSMRIHFNCHKLVVQGLICANDLVIKNHGILIEQVGEETLVEEDLRAKIESLQGVNISLGKVVEALRSGSENDILRNSDYGSCITMYEGCIEGNKYLISNLEGKIERLYEMEHKTSSLFSDAEPLYCAAERGMVELKQAWNSSIGQFRVSTDKWDWKKTIYKAWSESAYSLNQEYGVEIPTSTAEELLEALAGEKLYSIKSALDKNQSISLIDRGVCFHVKKIKGKYYLTLSGSVLEKSMPNKWETIEGILKKNVKDVDWGKVKVKELVTKGVDVKVEGVKVASYKELDDYLDVFANPKGNILKAMKGSFKKTMKRNVNILDDFKLSGYLKKSDNLLTKGGKALGAVGTVFTVKENVEANLIVNGKLQVTPDRVQDTITDTGIDVVTGAGAAAAGAAIGTLCCPGVGTAAGAVIGAVVGIVIDTATRWDIEDVNQDGEKDSLVDITKIGVDSGCDAIGKHAKKYFEGKKH